LLLSRKQFDFFIQNIKAYPECIILIHLSSFQNKNKFRLDPIYLLDQVFLSVEQLSVEKKYKFFLGGRPSPENLLFLGGPL
jgi:hypothetical protein